MMAAAAAAFGGKLFAPWAMSGRGEFRGKSGEIRNVNGRGHGSAGYAVRGAFGRCRFGARRSMRRAGQIHAGKFVRQ